jgi:hypothetical protein
VDEREDDLVVALRDLGDDLVSSRPGARDPVAGAQHEIGAGRPLSGAGAVTSRSSVRRGLAQQRARRMPRPARRSVVVTIAGMVVAVALVVAAPGPRGAVADLLGIGGVRVVPRDELPGGAGEPTGDTGVPDDVARDFDLGDSMPVESALAAAPGPMRPGALGDPDAAFAGLPEGAVTLAWDAGDGLPAIEAAAPTGWGLVLTAFPGATGEPAIFKAPEPTTSVHAVMVGGRAGYWISGRTHTVSVLDPSGRPGPHVVRLAGNTLLWTEGDLTYRLESGLDRDAAVALAESIPPPGG